MHNPLGWIGAATLAVAAAAPTAAGPVTADENAALRWWRTFSLVTHELEEALGSLPADPGAPDWRIDPKTRTEIEGAADVVESAMRAASMPECDFGVDYDQGLGALLPHLGSMRAVAKLLAADARLKLEAGDDEAAADRLVAVYQAAADVVDDRLLISALVCVSIFSQADQLATRMEAENALDDIARLRIGDALARFEATDPFGVRAAVLGERDLLGNWIRTRYKGAGAGERFLNELRGMMPAIDESVAESLRSAESLDAFLALYDLYYSAILEAWDQPDARDRLSAIERSQSDGDYGPLVSVVGMAPVRMHDRYAESLRMYQAAVDRARVVR